MISQSLVTRSFLRVVGVQLTGQDAGPLLAGFQLSCLLPSVQLAITGTYHGFVVISLHVSKRDCLFFEKWKAQGTARSIPIQGGTLVPSVSSI